MRKLLFLLPLLVVASVAVAQSRSRVLRIPKHGTEPASPGASSTYAGMYMDTTCNAMRVSLPDGGWAPCPILAQEEAQTGESIAAGACTTFTYTYDNARRGDHCCTSADEFLNGLVLECVVPVGGGEVQIKVCNPSSGSKELPTTNFNITLVPK